MIKYKQYDGDIGAGWSIKAGGYRITRTIYGFSDEWPETYDKDLLNNIYGTTKEAYLATLYEESWQYLSSFYHPILQKANISVLFKDSEPDQFTYISPTTNGHFLISDRKSRKVEILDQFQDKINFPQTATFDNLELIDNSGNIFKYGSDKNDNQFKEEGESDITAWALRKIITPFNGEINFTYQINEINEVYGRRDRFSIIEASKILGQWKNSTVFTAYFDEEQDQTPPYKAACFITEISSDKEVVQFVRDIKGSTPYLLKEIIIKNKSGITLKSIKFEYKNNEHRLLSKIEIQDGNSTKQKEYSFEYYDGPLDSYGIYPDQWGYYKYNNNGSSLAKYYMFHKEFENNQYITWTSYPTTGNIMYKQESVGDMFTDRNKHLPNGSYPKYWLLDRSSSENNPNYFSLKKITYPTGGTEEYEYESHQFKNGKGEKQYGGGLRISKIISKENHLSKSIISIYKYGNNENGYSIVDPNLNNYNKLFRSETYNYNFYQYTKDPVFGSGDTHMIVTPIRTYSTHPMGDDAPYNSFSYSHLTIYRSEGNDYGRVISEYIPSSVYTTDVNTASIQPGYDGSTEYNHDFYIKLYKPGYESKLKSQIYINQSNDTVKKKEFSYKDVLGKEYEGLRVIQKIFPSVDDENNYAHQLYTNMGIYKHINSLFKEIPYKIIRGTKVLSDKKEFDYDTTTKKPIIISESYTYDDKNRQITSTKTNSSGGTLVNEIIYPVEGSALSSKNMISTVIETVAKNTTKEVGRIKNIYDNSSILPSSIQTSSGGLLRTDLSFKKYDDKGNILHIETLDGMNTIYLWGYSNQYPIAEIKVEGYSYAEIENIVKSVFSITSIDALSKQATPTETKLKDGSLQNALPNALVTTYTYKPLVGVLTMTDPRGVTTHYDYDAFGRLKETYMIENGVKKVIQVNEYHYQNQ